MAKQRPPSIIDVVGEGRTDVGPDVKEAEPPTQGVVPVLLYTLCGKPPEMLVRRYRFASLQGKGLWQKVRFAKLRARNFGAAAATFVIDTEGQLEETRTELHRGRDSVLREYPMALGFAHPCIEAWLLADARAIAKGLGLSSPPALSDEPESLPAPRKDDDHNPKAVLANRSGSKRTSAAQKTAIARAMNDMALVRRRCPQSFAPFADEVEQRIAPIFEDVEGE